MAMMGMVSLPLKADETQCKAVLHDCDKAVKALETENALQKQIISDEDARYKAQHQELEIEQVWKPLCIGGIIVISVETVFLLFKK
jgi:hypothetical protein